MLELFIVLPYIIHGKLSPLSVQRALGLIMGGPFTFAFWGLFMALGLLLPLALELWETAAGAAREGAPLHPARGLAVAVGGAGPARRRACCATCSSTPAR